MESREQTCPAFQMEDDELDHLVAFLQAYSNATGKRAPVAGMPAAGAKCTGAAEVRVIGLARKAASTAGPHPHRRGTVERVHTKLRSESPGDYQAVTMVIRDGKDRQFLWKLNTGNRLVTSAITYSGNGKQYGDAGGYDHDRVRIARKVVP